MTVTWSYRALSNVAGIFARLLPHSEAAASRLVDRLMAAGGSLAQHPMMGRPGRLAGRRELVVDQYVLVYRLSGDQVRILSVEHGARRK
jgi:plasmid stabilization system protein ParE